MASFDLNIYRNRQKGLPKMKIHGFNTLTLLDSPGHVGATLFLGGCNFRCPFCQNGNLVLHPEQEPFIPEEQVFSFLKKRQGILDGVCISGGEPTLCPGLPELAEKIKSLGYLVKLDTNGSRPDVLRQLCESGLIDYVAMDIKSSRKNYKRVAGCESLSLEAIEKSVTYLMEHVPTYEFRTTVVRELHTASDFEDIADWLCGCHAYYLQAYRDSDHVIHPGFSSYSRAELEAFCEILRKKIPLTVIRGID